MIHGLSEKRRIPRLGRIRLGVMIKEAGKRDHPTATDHFVITEAIRKAVMDDRIPELEIARQSWCTCKHGEGPKALPVMLPTNAIDQLFPQNYRMYKRAGLWCGGDGQVARRWNSEGKLEERACPCEFLESGECGAEATLSITLPDVPGIGVWQITTGNYKTIVNLNTQLEDLALAFQGLRGIPLILRLEPQESQRWDAERKEMVRTTIHCMRLDAEISMRQIVEWRTRVGLPSQSAAVGMLLPGPGPVEEPTEPTEPLREPPWDISMCFRAAGTLGVSAAAYERFFRLKYGRATSDCEDVDAQEQKALFDSLATDPERAKQFAEYANGRTDEHVRAADRQRRKDKAAATDPGPLFEGQP